MATGLFTQDWPIGATVVTIEDLGGIVSGPRFEGDELVPAEYGVVVPTGTPGKVIEHFEDGRILCEFRGNQNGHIFRDPSTFLRLASQKSPEEIRALKRNWEYDAIWDIEETEGFEAHYDELLAYRRETEARWNREYQERLERKAEELGVPGNTKLAEYVLGLERRLDQMNGALETVYFRN